MSSYVLIESDWNLKISDANFSVAGSGGINRIRLEFKVHMDYDFER